jgi:excisionase family DNA binding protein
LPLAVPPLEAARLLMISRSQVYGMMRAGELESYLDGRVRRITTDSIQRYIARRIAASGPWQQWAHSPPRLREQARWAREADQHEPNAEMK